METNISSTSLMVTWERPPVPLVGYNVSYKAIETAGAPTFNAKHGQVAVGGDKTVLQISGLEPFTTYRITVTPQATAGEKMKGSFVYVGKFKLLSFKKPKFFNWRFVRPN